jgi:hypothetical protein
LPAEVQLTVSAKQQENVCWAAEGCFIVRKHTFREAYTGLLAHIGSPGEFLVTQHVVTTEEKLEREVGMCLNMNSVFLEVTKC